MLLSKRIDGLAATAATAAAATTTTSTTPGATDGTERLMINNKNTTNNIFSGNGSILLNSTDLLTDSCKAKYPLCDSPFPLRALCFRCNCPLNTVPLDTGHLYSSITGAQREQVKHTVSALSVNNPQNNNTFSVDASVDPFVEMRLCQRHSDMSLAEGFDAESIKTMIRRWKIAKNLFFKTVLPPSDHDYSHNGTVSARKVAYEQQYVVNAEESVVSIESVLQKDGDISFAGIIGATDGTNSTATGNGSILLDSTDLGADVFNASILERSIASDGKYSKHYPSACSVLP